MKSSKVWIQLLGVALFATAAPALAADEDAAACEGKAQGDACTDETGEAGNCLPDDQSGTLECESATDQAEDQAEAAACEGKAQGDACTDDDGEAGTCEPDDDGTGALECEDPDDGDESDDDDDDATGEASSGIGGASGCSAAGTPATGASVVLALVAALGLRRRKI
jgi:uncharacterized protein (TIGR03382 family)